ncbi:flagellar motor switch protein FliN [Gellertiella hungarica]|uniref:Flagellar motor switch protein FliN n=1 Tax=Gellertiella hungarica TaxID=1572859 RepID=A0A7W6J3M2_9HYPH|nr:flagellar motor switch protein FliN [Gellertiella hungarica]MBB4064107.1 flagellar motor switch protein FliN/FliY [Gellertiella hungarica]
MATQKNPQDSDFSMDAIGSDADLENAIDDLRGVLKNDAEGTMPELGEFGGDFGATAAGGTDLSSFGGQDFSAKAPAGGGWQDASPRTQAPGSALNSNLDLIMDIPIDVQIVLGTSRMQVSGLMNLNEGATIALDKKIGEPVDIMVNGRRIARGEITVMENDDTRFGVRLIEVMSTRKG